MYLLSGYVLAAGTWALAANYGLSRTPALFINGVMVGDKIIHFLVVGGFAVVLARAIRGFGWQPKQAVWAGMAVAAFMATGEELSNALTPHRTCSGLDLVADYAGILMLSGVAWLTMFRPALAADSPVGLPSVTLPSVTLPTPTLAMGEEPVMPAARMAA